MTYIYDLEVFHNCFTATFIPIDAKSINRYIKADIDNNESEKKIALNIINPKIFIVFNETNQMSALVSFIRNKNTNVLIGYNNNKYDNIILDYIISEKLHEYNNSNTITKKIKNISDTCINYMGNFRKDYDIPYSNLYFSIDLMSLHYLDKRRISLKQVSIALKWYRVEDYSMPKITEFEADEYYDGNFPSLKSFDRYVINEHLSGIIDYNINDVLITLELYKHSKSELQQRINTSKKYKVNVLSSSRSSVADRLMSKFYQSATGYSYWDYYNKRTYRRLIKFNDIIDKSITFNSEALINFLTILKSNILKVGSETFKELLIFKGTAYTFATGGLHSVDSGAIYNNSKYNLIDADVNSFYPTVMINLNVYPEHVNPIFVSLVKELTILRLNAKAKGDIDTADILKIVINAIYGKLGFEYGWLFDLKAMYKVTINGQLYLMKLIEDLELANIHVISANTDGIVSIIPDSKLEEYYNICNSWAKSFNLGVTYTNYKKYVRTTVNDYITIKENGSIKTKGDFSFDIKIDKGYFAPVIAKTLYEYYINDNHDIDTVIRNYNIYDYCISIKVGSQFKSELHSIKNGKLNIEVLQKDNRYFVSNKGGIFLKHNTESNKFTNVIKGYYVTIFNKFYNSDDYNINYDWYKIKVLDIINKINKSTTKEMKKHCGTLFD